MSLPDSLTHLAGFALGHALWNVCDFEDEEEVLCPFAVTFDGQQRNLLRFEADSQEASIDLGRESLSADTSLTHWAFAREGLIPTQGDPIDVLLVEAWSQELESPIVFAQPFQPALSGEFCLLGAPAVFVGGEALSEDAVLEQFKAGVLSHQRAAELWDEWQGW